MGNFLVVYWFHDMLLGKQGEKIKKGTIRSNELVDNE